MEQISETLGSVLNLLLVAVGLGFVIFVHELGHFLVAKWAGVLVERFSIGFGPILWSFRGKETQYALSAIPFGGYVKMLGENPDEPTRDPRAYSQQPVPKRMAIISAGVVMNIIFGFLFFLLVFNLGIPYMPAVVGAVEPGSPAWQAGLERGDRILQVNGERITEYETFQQAIWLSSTERSLDLQVERGDQQLRFHVTPRVGERSGELMPHVGVISSWNLVLDEPPPVVSGSAAARADGARFEKGDRIVAVNGERVESYAEFAGLLAQLAAEDIRVLVERAGGKDGARGETATVVVPPSRIRDPGLRFQMGKITAIQNGSPAQQAGLAVGDVIKSVNDAVFDPLRLPDTLSQLAKSGRDAEIAVIRQSAAEHKEQHVRKLVHPADRPAWITPPFQKGDPLTVPALGLAYQLVPAITAEPEPGSAAARAGLHKNDRITGGVLIVPAEDARGKQTTIEFPVDDKNPNLPALFWSIQFYPTSELKLTYKRGEETLTTELFSPEESPDWSAPVRARGLNLTPLSIRMPPQGFVRSLELGYETTRSTIAKIYLTLRRLVTRSIPITNLSGPIGIGVAAYYQASTSVTVLIKFLGILSINLAIVNFLPIPVLDGGHMVFLAWEWIRGKPASERVLIAANYAGLILILTLALLVTGHDIWQLMKWRGGF